MGGWVLIIRHLICKHLPQTQSLFLFFFIFIFSTVWKGQNVAWLHHDKPSIYAKWKKWIQNNVRQARFSSFNTYAADGQSLGRIALYHEQQNRSENSMETYLKNSAICRNMALLDGNIDYHIGLTQMTIIFTTVVNNALEEEE